MFIDKFDEDLFTEWMKNPHYYHSFCNYDGHNYYNSNWNSQIQRLVNKNLTDESLVQKIIEANLEYLQIQKGVEIDKKFSKYLRDYHLKSFKARIDYLNNLKVDGDPSIQSVINQLQHATYIQLTHYNKKSFGIDETVKLFVDVKNIQKM